MAVSQSLVEQNRTSYHSVGEYTNELSDDTSGSSASTNEEDTYRDMLSNEHALLLPDGGSHEYEEDSDEIRANAQQHLDYRHENRFIILALVALTPTGVKFFKAAQSSFQEYLMTDPQLMMSATTYSLSLSLMSLPLATLIGGAMLDYKAKIERETFRQKQPHNRRRIRRLIAWLMPSQPSCIQSSRTPSYSAIVFLAITLLGIIIYGYGLEMLHSIPVGLAGSTIFGIGEGCVVVASRTFVAHAFYGSDGAFAQGVLVAMNNLAMMASKISLPWLIENQRKMESLTIDCIHNVSDCLEEEELMFGRNATTQDLVYPSDDTGNDEHDIWIGVVACCMVQLVSLAAGALYAWKFGLVPLPQSHLSQESDHASLKFSKKKKEFRFEGSTSIYSRVMACFDKLPITFWIVAIGRAIFVVVFKVFTRNSNSFLMEKFGVSPVTAGIKSSFHELFALGSPVVGYLAYRSPGGIVPVLLFAAALGSISIGTLACLPADVIQLYLPGGALTPIIGISIAHGIFIPICMAVIPQTVSPDQTGMAFAVVEVIGSIFNLTNILFGWLRDIMGNYQVAMEMLLGYTLVGMILLWMSRNHIKFEQPNEQ